MDHANTEPAQARIAHLAKLKKVPSFTKRGPPSLSLSLPKVTYAHNVTGVAQHRGLLSVYTVSLCELFPCAKAPEAITLLTPRWGASPIVKKNLCG